MLHKTILRLFFTLSSAVTIYSYIEPNFGEKNFSAIKATFCVFIAICLVLVLIIDIIDLVKSYRRKFVIDDKFPRKINNYMRKWIKQGARTVIATRDMSWANNPQTKSLLLEKARRSELVICLPKDIPLSQELKEAGAEVYTYPDLDYVLKSRFTIVRQGQAGSQVAVGMGSGSSHIIEEYQEGYHPCYAIANDLVEVIMRIRKTENVSTPARRAPKRRKS